MRKLGITIGLATLLLASGCSNASEVSNTVETNAVNEQTTETIVIEDSASVSSESENVQNESDNIFKKSLELLGKTDEESMKFFDGGEENLTDDGDLIGRQYTVMAFDEETTLFTMYREDGLVNYVGFSPSQKTEEEYRAIIESLFGAPSEIDDTPSEAGSTDVKWTVDGNIISLYKNYDDSIDISLSIPYNPNSEEAYDLNGEETYESEDMAGDVLDVMAETKAYPELEKLIISEYDIPEDFLDKTKYYYNYVDLNADGQNEIFVVVMGPYTSGSGGSSAMIVYPVGGELYVNQKFTLVQTPIIISDKMTNGAKEIIAYRSGGGAESTYVRLTCSDGNYTSINDGEPIRSLDGVVGTAIIANDIIEDIDNGTFLTLGK